MRIPQPGRRGYRTDTRERRLADALTRLERNIALFEEAIARLQRAVDELHADTADALAAT